LHRIAVRLHWHLHCAAVTVRGEADVTVTRPADARHARVAKRLLETRDVHLVLAIGGDHHVAGIKAIGAALKSPVLAPHFAVIEAKRLGRRFLARAPDVEAARLIDGRTVMSGVKVSKLAKIAGSGSAPSDFAQLLRTRAQGCGMTAAGREALDAL
jgi:hypothetical protein